MVHYKNVVFSSLETERLCLIGIFITELRDMCITAIANMQHQTQRDKGSPTLMFSLTKDIIPFLEQHWEALTTASRRSTQTWHTTVSQLGHFKTR